ncbi:MAG TPA: hypothetical protein VGF68_11210, partial [Solirubrobacteraceae bacterium]
DEELRSDDEGGHDEDDIEDEADAEAEDAEDVVDDTPTEVAEPDDRSEIERTVAFKPLDDDDTTVIRPASEAANRRADK